MSYYVTVKDSSGRKTIYAAGPFNRHGDALRMVGPVHDLIVRRYPSDATWAQYGTARVCRGNSRSGRFNGDLGLPDGCIGALSAEVTQGRWVTGDVADSVGYVLRHGSAAEGKRVARRVGRVGAEGGAS